MPSTQFTQQRLERYLKRQGRPAWGADYQPAIRATPKEAPKISRAYILIWLKLLREIHLLSLSELVATLLALYHPALLDIQEQRLLSTTPAPHPLFRSPYATEVNYPPFAGLLDVAQRLGYLNYLPKIWCPSPEDPQEYISVPIPFVGDLLLFLRDEAGVPYCVNWTVKKDDAGFLKRPGALKTSVEREVKAQRNASIRHEIEEVYYADASIRTQRVTQSSIDRHVFANLRQLFLWHGRKTIINSSQREAILEMIKALVDSGRSLLSGLSEIERNCKCTSYECRTVFYQGIWQREIRVDLFRPVLIDKPLHKEQKDVLAVYAHLFRR